VTKRGSAEAADIQATLQPYDGTTLLSEATDPHLLYVVQARLAVFA
jgi:hypothetical protein